MVHTAERLLKMHPGNCLIGVAVFQYLHIICLVLVRIKKSIWSLLHMHLYSTVPYRWRIMFMMRRFLVFGDPELHHQVTTHFKSEKVDAVDSSIHYYLETVLVVGASNSKGMALHFRVLK